MAFEVAAGYVEKEFGLLELEEGREGGREEARKRDVVFLPSFPTVAVCEVIKYIHQAVVCIYIRYRAGARLQLPFTRRGAAVRLFLAATGPANGGLLLPRALSTGPGGGDEDGGP
jgi:hypothetical protein